MKENMKLYFLRNLEDLEKDDVTSHVTEYEITSDAYIVGEFKHGPYYFCLWEFGNKPSGEERKLCLRVREKAFPTVYRPEEPDGYSGFYHGGSIPDELVCLSSLFLRRRFKLGPVIRWNDVPTLFPRIKQKLDKQIVLGKSNLKDLHDWFLLMEGLDSKFHLRFLLAVRLYHRSLLLIDDQPDMAYLDLVSSIETLSRDHNIGKMTLADINNKKLEKLVYSISNEETRVNIANAIVKKERFIKRRFISFILSNIEDSFWTENRPELGQIKHEELKRLLGKIYDQRSETLHNGEPFPQYIFSSPTVHNEEIPCALSISYGEKKWRPTEYIPYPHFVERLVNHVLKTFLKRHQVNVA